MKFTLYRADRLGMPENCVYPHKVAVTDKNTLLQAVSYDYVCAEYRGNYRNNDNFLGADCLPVDCDNDHSDDPGEWVYPSDVAAAFPGVAFSVHYSRNHMKPKRGKAPRPKFHCILLTDAITDHEEYKRLAKLAHKVFPYFDTRAEDAAHFFFGTPDAHVEFYPGTITLNECLEMYYPDTEDDSFWDLDSPYTDTIPEGSRNSTMSHFAGRVLKRFGDTDEAYQAFLKRAAKCEPPLGDDELKTIWHSAQNFYQRISKEEDYVPPEEWNAERSSGFKYDPPDRTDVGQARLLGTYFGQELRYSPATDYIRYDGSCWQETKPGAQAVAHALTDKQLEEAEAAMAEAVEALTETGAQELLSKHGKKKAESIMESDQRDAFMAYLKAESYHSFVLKRRESKNITATLKEARPVLEIEPGLLDKDWFPD